MANTHTTLSSLFTAIANKIRVKTGSTAEMTADNFPNLIDNIATPADGTIPTKTSSDLTANGATVTVPAGYYAANATKSVSTTGLGTPSISVSSSGLITSTVSHSASGWVDAASKSNTKQLTTQSAKTVTPSTSSQTAVASGRYTTGAVTVAAVPTQTKTVNPEASSQVIYPDSGKFLSSVTVLGDGDLVPANIVSGKTIFNVAGTADVLETNAPFTYSVNSISGAQYGFALGSDGYYESLNKGVDNSFAICRVNLNVKTTCNLTFDVIYYAEGGYDCGIFSLLDTSLNLDTDVDDNSKCHKSFRYGSDSSPSVVNVTYSLTVGSHFIDIKFKKDSSTSKYNDSVKFKVQYNYSLPESTLQKIQQLDPNLVSSNIKSGVDIFGVNGVYSGTPIIATGTTMKYDLWESVTFYLDKTLNGWTAVMVVVGDGYHYQNYDTLASVAAVKHGEYCTANCLYYVYPSELSFNYWDPAINSDGNCTFCGLSSDGNSFTVDTSKIMGSSYFKPATTYTIYVVGY